MSKKIWRPLNTWGIYALGVVISFAVIYSLLEVANVVGRL